jgi:hypothetical protein
MIEGRSTLEMAADWVKVLSLLGTPENFILWVEQRMWFPRWVLIEWLFAEH